MITDKLSRIAFGSLSGRALRWPLRLLPKRAVVTVRAGVNQGLRWIAGSSTHGCWLGHYEQEHQELLGRLTRPGMKVFDIGANAGFYTLAFSRLVGEDGHVWAFEPFAENASNLLRHLALNRIANVTLIQVAVADAHGVTGFRVAANNAQGLISSNGEDYLIPTVGLDALIAANTVPRPDLIKMDVEGAESRVLAGAQRLLEQGTATLVISLHGHEQTRACLSLLNQAGYQAFRLDGQPVAADGEYVGEIYAMPAAKTGAAARSAGSAPP